MRMEKTVQDSHSLTSTNNSSPSQKTSISSASSSSTSIYPRSSIPWSSSTSGDLLGMENGIFLSDGDHGLIKLMEAGHENATRKKPKFVHIKKEYPPLISTWSSPRNKMEWVISKYCVNGRVILKKEKAKCRNHLEVKRVNHRVILNFVQPIDVDPSHHYDQSMEKDKGKKKMNKVDELDELEFNGEETNNSDQDQEVEDSTVPETNNVGYNVDRDEEEDGHGISAMFPDEAEDEKGELHSHIVDEVKKGSSRVVLASSLPTYLVSKKKKEKNEDSRMCFSYVTPKMVEQSALLGVEIPMSKLVFT